jgi:hypothetical protein
MLEFGKDDKEKKEAKEVIVLADIDDVIKVLAF